MYTHLQKRVHHAVQIVPILPALLVKAAQSKAAFFVCRAPRRCIRQCGGAAEQLMQPGSFAALALGRQHALQVSVHDQLLL